MIPLDICYESNSPTQDNCLRSKHRTTQKETDAANTLASSGIQSHEPIPYHALPP